MKLIIKTVILFTLINNQVFAEDTDMDPVCPDSELFSGKLITDICWSCIFPIRIAGYSTGFIEKEKENPKAKTDGSKTPKTDHVEKELVPGSTEDTVDKISKTLNVNKKAHTPDGAADAMICVCSDDSLIPRIGFTLGFWVPSRMIEVVKNPGCSPALGGTNIGIGSFRQRGTDGEYGKTTAQVSTRHVHYWAFPILMIMKLLFETDCLGDPYADIDILYLSEVDPTWSSDELSFITTPEAILFANPLALIACSADGLAASTYGEGFDTLFWCAGTWGRLYPLSGVQGPHGSRVRESSLLAARMGALMHRRLLARKSMGDDAVCGSEFYPFYPKTQYRLSQFYPLAEKSSNHAIGETDFNWGMWRTIPGTGEDFMYLQWRWSDCCLFFY